MNVAICLGVGGLVAEVRGAPNLGFWEGTGGFGLNCLNIYVLINQQLLSKKPFKKKRMNKFFVNVWVNFIVKIVKN